MRSTIVGVLLLFASALHGQQCDPALWSHTYHQQRFTIIAKCKSFDGTIEAKKREADGDIHIHLRLDPGQGHPLNHFNVTRQKSCLVLEPICEGKVTQADAITPCHGARKVPVPAIGAHVRVTGIYVVDTEGGHGWIELHPVTSFEPLP